jgi:APA family basic amino acid/polyamine antiporter
MARDGLLPSVVGKLHPRFKTPWITSIVTGAVVAFFAAISNLNIVGELCSIGTLLAFAIVSGSVLILRIREPHHDRAFKTPMIWLVAPLGVISAVALMAALPLVTWERLAIWFAVGLVIYFGFGFRNSKLRAK